MATCEKAGKKYPWIQLDNESPYFWGPINLLGLYDSKFSMLDILKHNYIAQSSL